MTTQTLTPTQHDPSKVIDPRTTLDHAHLIVNSLEDMAGNVMFSTSFFFTTSFAPDMTPPAVVATTPVAGGTPRPETVAEPLRL